MVFYKFLWWCPQVGYGLKEHGRRRKKPPNFNIFKVMQSTSETSFNCLLSSVGFDDNS